MADLNRVQIEPLDHTADTGLRVRAVSAAAAFAAVAEGMFDIMLDRSHVPERCIWHPEVDADSWCDLVVAWLEELLYQFYEKLLVPHRIIINDLVPRHLKATLYGDTFDVGRDHALLEIKAVTYHQLHAEAAADGFEIQVIFDV